MNQATRVPFCSRRLQCRTFQPQNGELSNGRAQDNRRIQAWTTRVYTERLFRKLGINDASFHSLRHTAASWLVMHGEYLYTVGQLLGHRTPRMTQRYAHLSPKYMAGAVGKLDSVFRGVMPENASDEPRIVTIASPDFANAGADAPKLLN